MQCNTLLLQYNTQTLGVYSVDCGGFWLELEPVTYAGWPVW